MTATKWTIGERIYDDSYKMHGTIYDVDDSYHSEVVVIFVRWDNGNVSDFTPDEGTRKVESPCTRT